MFEQKYHLNESQDCVSLQRPQIFAELSNVAFITVICTVFLNNYFD